MYYLLALIIGCFMGLLPLVRTFVNTKRALKCKNCKSRNISVNDNYAFQDASSSEVKLHGLPCDTALVIECEDCGSQYDLEGTCYWNLSKKEPI